MQFPEEGLVYDYRLDDAGIAQIEADDEADDDQRNRKVWRAELRNCAILKK